MTQEGSGDPLAPGKRPDGDVDGLLEAIYEHPQLDAPRLVYSDVLQERGDPRGEFIALQMLAKRTRAQGKRMNALLRAHRDAWLGPLALAVKKSRLVFERGFLARATLRRRRGNEPGVIGHPSWGTVVELDGAVDVNVVAHSCMRALRALRDVDLQTALALMEHESPLALETLDIDRVGVYEREPIAERDVKRIVSRARGLPMLTHLGIDNVHDVSWLSWLFDSELGRRLSSVRLSALVPGPYTGPDRPLSMFTGPGLAWLLLREQRPETVTLTGAWTFTLRDRALDVTVTKRKSTADWGGLTAVCRSLAGLSLDSLRLAHPRWLTATPAEVAALAEVLAHIQIAAPVTLPSTGY